MKDRGFETKSLRMERLLQVCVFAPEEDVERIMAHVCEITPLSQGDKYDSNAYQSAPGIERYRPLDGAAAGPETEVRKRPGVVAVSFELPDDQALLAQVVEAIFQVHAPNGIGLSLDAAVLYVAETPTARLWAYEIEALIGRSRVLEPLHHIVGGQLLEIAQVGLGDRRASCVELGRDVDHPAARGSTPRAIDPRQQCDAGCQLERGVEDERVRFGSARATHGVGDPRRQLLVG